MFFRNAMSAFVVPSAETAVFELDEEVNSPAAYIRVERQTVSFERNVHIKLSKLYTEHHTEHEAAPCLSRTPAAKPKFIQRGFPVNVMVG